VDLRKYSRFLWSQKTLLSATEHERSDRFCFAIHREDYVNSHVALRILVAEHLHDKPECISLRFPYMHRPYLAGKNAHFNISLSRSCGVAIVALHTGRQIGVDIERERSFEEREALVLEYGAEAEKALFFRLKEHERENAFWRWWVAKEACLKAIGLGFSYSSQDVSVGFIGGDKTVRAYPRSLGIDVDISSINIVDQKYFFAIALR